MHKSCTLLTLSLYISYLGVCMFVYDKSLYEVKTSMRQEIETINKDEGLFI